MRLSDYALEPGEIPDYFPSIWPSFVRTVIQITVEAYIALSKTRCARPSWEEDAFTINLEDRLRPIAYDNPMNLQVRSRSPVYTQAMRTGETSTTEAKIIDIQMWGHWHQYADVYFAWECKLLADRQGHNRNLINEYISNGMLRFLNGQYSEHVPDAGMLGYILAGDVPEIVAQINASMVSSRRERPLQKADALAQSTPVGTFRDIYRSSHAREPKRVPITLHHLLLKFDFPEN